MDPVTLAALAASAIPAIAKLFGGGKQVKDAKALAAGNKFTRYQTPEQVLQATKLAEGNYRNGMPGQSRAENRIGTMEAGALNTATQGASSSGDLIDASTRINFGADQASNQLADQEAAYKAQALQGYEGALNNEAQYADKAYQINYLDPYIRKANTAAAMYGAGKINQQSGLDGLATTALTAASMFGQKPENPVFGKINATQPVELTKGAGAQVLPNFGFQQFNPTPLKGLYAGVTPSYPKFNTSNIAAAMASKGGYGY